MAGKGRAGIASGVIIGGTVLIGAILLAIAAMLVLSLISLFPPNHSVQQYGSQYQASAAMLKALYSATAAASISNSTVAENTALSSACATAARSAGGVTSFAGCVITGLRAYLASNNSNSSRRRRDSEFGTYLTGVANMYFTSACESGNDKSKYSNSSSISYCTKSRLNMCNTVFGGSDNKFKQWSGLASGSTISYVPSGASSYSVLTILRVFGIPSSLAAALATSIGFSASVISQFSAGCQFVGFVSQDTITNALAAQNSATTTQPTTTNMASG